MLRASIDFHLSWYRSQNVDDSPHSIFGPLCSSTCRRRIYSRNHRLRPTDFPLIRWNIGVNESTMVDRTHIAVACMCIHSVDPAMSHELNYRYSVRGMLLAVCSACSPICVYDHGSACIWNIESMGHFSIDGICSEWSSTLSLER